MLAPSASASPPLEFREESDSLQWDRLLAKLGGHPLQSSLWGDARRQADDIADRRWILLSGGRPVWMARVEERRIPGLGWIGWMPRGPAGSLSIAEALPLIATQPSARGLSVVVTDEWKEDGAATSKKRPLTAWVDLSAGVDALLRELTKIRHGVAHARRAGVTVVASSSASDVDEFYALCQAVSAAKQFAFTPSPALMRSLLERRSESVEARLFVARHQEKIAGGAFVIRCGRSLHYFWGATDRAAGSITAGEALQWAAIEWGIAAGCVRYDVEGLDPDNNPGTYNFKKKLGGREVRLPGKQFFPLNARGRCVTLAHRLCGGALF